jgi:DNA-binding NarL/FixJ family response regulator
MAQQLFALLVIRQRPLQTAMAALLATLPQIELVGQVRDAGAARSAITTYHPDLVVLDAALPTPDVRAILEQLNSLRKSSRCIVLAEDLEQQQMLHAAGASAVLLVGSPAAEVVTTIERLLATNAGESRDKLCANGHG